MAIDVPRHPLIINGERREPSSGQYLDVVNPATGALAARAARANDADLDAAVSAARHAFEDKTWRDMPPADRSALLYRCAQLLTANAPELIELEVQQSGGTVNRIGGLDIPALADLCMTTAEAVLEYPFVENLPPRILPELCHTTVWRQPVGVCGLITAWNFPLFLFGLKCIPALATGNTMVVKPSEATPGSTTRFAEILQQVLPPGVLNVVNGEGATVGEAMSLHPGIDKLSFTGSTAVGKRVQANCALSVKRCTLELGGKGPGIVLPDADLNMVAQGALFGVYLNAGQACESGTRLLVHDSIYDTLLGKLVQRSADVQVGDPSDPATGMGPMSSESHYHKVLKYIASAVDEGGRIACGGSAQSVPGCEDGFFVQPTVIADMNNRMRAAREEIFGPVLAVIKYSTEEEALALANDTHYGLSAGVWTSDLLKAQQLARELNAGSVWINDWHMLRTDAPFGGFGESGLGRELGKFSLDAYLETKTVSTAFETSLRMKNLHCLVHTHMA